MSPYLTAFHKYQEIERGVSWTDALDFHFQHGVVISTPEVFVMAREVGISWANEDYCSLVAMPFGRRGLWHVWACAGDLGKLLELAKSHGVKRLVYQRHGVERCRRKWLWRIAEKARVSPPVQSPR